MASFRTSKDYLNKLQTYFSLLLLGPLIIFVLAYLKYGNGDTEGVMESPSQAISAAVFIGAAVLTLLGMIRFRVNMAKVRKLEKLRAQLNAHFAQSMQMFLLFTVGAYTLAIIYYLSASQAYFVAFIAQLIFFGMHSPSIYHLLRALKPSKERALTLQNEMPIAE